MRAGALLLGMLAWSSWAGSALADDPAPGRRRDIIARGERPYETESPPPGFHEEHRPRYGLIIGGAATLAFAGLWLGAAANERAQATRGDVDGSAHSAAGVMSAIGIVHLVVGVPLLTIGLLSSRDIYVRDRVASVAFAPLVSADRVGGALALRF